MASWNFYTCATLYQHEKKGPWWIFYRDPDNAEPEDTIYFSRISETSGRLGIIRFFLGIREKRSAVLTGILARGHSGADLLLEYSLIHSNRYPRISAGKCKLPGDFECLADPRAARRRHRCVRCCLFQWILLAGSCWFFV